MLLSDTLQTFPAKTLQHRQRIGMPSTQGPPTPHFTFLRKLQQPHLLQSVPGPSRPFPTEDTALVLDRRAVSALRQASVWHRSLSSCELPATATSPTYAAMSLDRSAARRSF